MSKAKPESSANKQELKRLGHSNSGEANELLALEAMESLNGNNTSFSPLEERLQADDDPNILRAASVLAEGLGEGFATKTENALSVEQLGNTATTATEAYSIGYGLGALSKAGPLGQKAATIASLGMGAYWIGSELIAGRPQDTYNAVAEAYHSGQNIEKNRQQIALSGGGLLFDTTLAMGVGGAGLKHGLKNPENWHLNVADSAGKQINKLGQSFQDNGNLGYSRSFAGRDGTADNIFNEVKTITKDNGNKGNGFGDIQQQLKQQAIKADGQLKAYKEELLTHQKEHTALTAQEITLNNQLSKLSKERLEVDTSSQAQANLKKAQEAHGQIKELAQTIKPKEAELTRLEKEADSAKKVADATNANTMEITNERQLYNEKLEKVQRARQEMQSLKEMTNEGAQERAQTRLSEAQRKLTEEQEARPEKLKAVDKALEEIQEQLTLLNSRQQTLEGEAAQVIAQFKARQAELEKNPDLVEKVQEVEVETPNKPADIEAPIKAPDKPEPVETAPPTETQLDFSPEVVAKQAIEKPTSDKVPVSELQQVVDSQKSQAVKAVRENELGREIQANEKIIADIERGTLPKRSNQDPEVMLQEAKERIQRAKEELGDTTQTSYTKAIKQVAEYAKTVSKQLAQTADSNVRGEIAVDAVRSIENLMDRLPNSYKGYTEKLPDLQERTTGSPEMRLTLLKEHLEAKSRLLDQSRNHSLQEMAESHPVLNQIVQRQAENSLPADGTIILFDKEGHFINQSGTRSPHFMEVSRWNQGGIGADGAGLNRFSQHMDNIGGAVVLRPLYQDGVPVQVPNKTTNGKPVYKKVVAEVLGDIPQEIQTDMNFVEILRRFAPGD
jgi:hypothetical protein